MKANFYLLLLLLFSLLKQNANATTYYARSNGNWNSTNTWSTVSRTGPVAGTIPSSSDNVIIDARIVTVANGNAFANNITVQAVAYGTTYLYINNGRTLTVDK